MHKKDGHHPHHWRDTSQVTHEAMTEHRAWMEKAINMAHLPPEKGGSPHPTVQVGAVLVSADGHMIAAASNRFAEGVDWQREERYESGMKSLWINCAEQMVLAYAARQRAELQGARLYVTLEPCAVCAGLIAEFGIREIYVPINSRQHYAKLKAKWKHSIDIGQIKLMEAGVHITPIDI